MNGKGSPNAIARLGGPGFKPKALGLVRYGL